jgi:ABC-type multidrug transport system ATPase subunit
LDLASNFEEIELEGYANLNANITTTSNEDDYDQYLGDFLNDFSERFLNDIRFNYDDGVLYGAILNNSDIRNSNFPFNFQENVKHSFTLFTNYSGVHSLPTYINGLSNSLLKSIVGDDFSITARNHPRPLTVDEITLQQTIQGFILLFYFCLAAAMIPSSFVTFIVMERHTKSKHQQLISGVSIPAYWISNLLWDTITYLLPFGVAMILLEISDNPNYVGDDTIGATITVFLLFGIAVIPQTYLFSFIFSKPANARSILILIYFLTGLVLVLASRIMEGIESTRDINENLKPLFRMFPIYCFGDSLFALATLNFTQLEPFDSEVVGTNVYFMTAEIFVYIILTIITEYLHSIPKITQKLRKFFCVDKMIPKSLEKERDDDVQRHREDIEKGDHDDKQVVVKGLRKIYGNKVAVNDLWLSMDQGECFGFLGVNGAGKTTTLSILSGDIPPTEGFAKLAGFDVLQDQLKMRRLIGYCPQFDALFERLTGREHLEFYARIKGVPEKKLKAIVEGMLHYLSLDEYADRAAGGYSGGNKRKLSVAMSLIGDPPIVFLDEPSTGMDPVARRFMWRFISETMAGRVVVLTTHSMEECESLCNRIGIMVDGGLSCIGTPQHLKNKFGKGYQLDISTTAENPSSIVSVVLKLFDLEETALIEIHGGVMKFKIPGDNLCLADVFDMVENNREELLLLEYSVGQTTLEQIFIQFAQENDLERGQLGNNALKPVDRTTEAEIAMV